MFRGASTQDLFKNDIRQSMLALHDITIVKIINFVAMCKALHSYFTVNMHLKNQYCIFHFLYSVNLIKCCWPSPQGFWPCRGYSHTGWHTSGGSRCPTSSCPRGWLSPRPASDHSIWNKNMHGQQRSVTTATSKCSGRNAIFDHSPTCPLFSERSIHREALFQHC